MPSGPSTDTKPPRPSTASAHASRSHPSSASRPTNAGPTTASASGKPARRGSRRRTEHVQRRVLGEDGRLESAQLGPGLDAQLVDQQPAGPLVGLQGVALTARAVQGHHELTPQTLTERLIAQERLDLAHQFGGSAVGQIRVHPVLHQRQTQLLQAAGLRHAPLDVAELPERLTPPQAQRLARRVDDGRIVPPLELIGAPPGQLLEPCGVELRGIEPQFVASTNRGDQCARLATRTTRLEGSAQPRHVGVHGPLRGARWPVTPHRVDERVDRNRGVHPSQQQREDETFLGPPNGDGPVAVEDLERPRTRKANRCPLGS